MLADVEFEHPDSGETQEVQATIQTSKRVLRLATPSRLRIGAAASRERRWMALGSIEYHLDALPADRSMLHDVVCVAIQQCGNSVKYTAQNIPGTGSCFLAEYRVEYRVRSACTYVCTVITNKVAGYGSTG